MTPFDPLAVAADWDSGEDIAIQVAKAARRAALEEVRVAIAWRSDDLAGALNRVRALIEREGEGAVEESPAARDPSGPTTKTSHAAPSLTPSPEPERCPRCGSLSTRTYYWGRTRGPEACYPYDHHPWHDAPGSGKGE